MIIKERKPKTILMLTGVGFFASGIDCLENKLITSFVFYRKHKAEKKINKNIVATQMIQKE